LGYFCNCKKLPKVNNRPIGENTPNPVTLDMEIFSFCFESNRMYVQTNVQTHDRDLTKQQPDGKGGKNLLVNNAGDTLSVTQVVKWAWRRGACLCLRFGGSAGGKSVPELLL
jgi:hypothetical protein